MTKSYKDLVKLSTFEERLEYLKLNARIGDESFGIERYLNQKFYKSREWQRVRDEVITRDNGCDLGIKDIYIFGKIIIHHINPISKEDILMGTDLLLDINNLICTSLDTHNYIHYGIQDDFSKKYEFEERRVGDTKLW